MSRPVIYVSLYILVLMFFSCKDSASVPGDVLAPARMKQVLYDLLLAESLLEQQDPLKKEEEKRIAIREQVLKGYQLNEGSFQKSLEYYRQHPQLYKEIADSVASYASRQVAESMNQQIKKKPDGHHLEDSSGSNGHTPGDR